MAKASGIVPTPNELHHGDCLKSSHVQDAVSKAGLVYLNNPRFGAGNEQILSGLHGQ